MDKGSKELERISKVVSRIKLRRRELNMTQTDLANVANLTPAAISQFESGTRKPSFNTLLSLSDALKVTTDYLLGKQERCYEDLLADPKINIMLRGMMEFTEKDKETLYEFYEFLKTKAAAVKGSGKETCSDSE